MRTLREIDLSAKDRTAVARAAGILRERFPVERVILFGSKARGDDQADSDIDLLVLTAKELDWKQHHAMVGILFDLEMELGVMLSPVVIATEEWEHGMSQALPLHDEVDRDGVLV